MLIEVKPDWLNLRWDVVMNGEVVGYCKHSYDADFWVETLANSLLRGQEHVFLDIQVNHHSEYRAALFEMFEREKLERRKLEKEELRRPGRRENLNDED